MSFSDPVPRWSAAGELVLPGHIGTVYQAHNACYLGRATPRTLRLLPDGTTFSARAAQKIRAGEQGWRYAATALVRHGASAPRCLSSGYPDAKELAAWLPAALAATTRRLRHAGNHRYAWALRRAARRFLQHPRPYPKQLDSRLREGQLELDPSAAEPGIV